MSPHLFRFVDSMDIAEFDRFLSRGFPFLLGWTRFHEPGVLQHEREHREANLRIELQATDRR